MKRNNGYIGLLIRGENFRGFTEMQEVYDLQKQAMWPYVYIIHSADLVNEGQSITLKIINVPDGSYTAEAVLISGTLLSRTDFSSGATAFPFTVSGGTGTVTIGLALDSFTEGTEIFCFNIKNSLSVVVATSRNFTVNDISTGTPEPAVYTLTSGIKAPVFGAGGGTYPPTGWTGLQNSSVDDGFVTISGIPSFYMAGTAYTTCYVGSNTYITFSAGSNNYSGLSASNPNFPKFMFGAADNSYQRVSSLQTADYTRIRYEGTASTGGTVGSPNIVYEATLFSMTITNNVPVMEVLFGNHSRTSGLTMVADTSTAYTTFTITPNNSYVFVGNATGTAWTVYSGYYMSGTNY